MSKNTGYIKISRIRYFGDDIGTSFQVDTSGDSITSSHSYELQNGYTRLTSSEVYHNIFESATKTFTLNVTITETGESLNDSANISIDIDPAQDAYFHRERFTISKTSPNLDAEFEVEFFISPKAIFCSDLSELIPCLIAIMGIQNSLPTGPSSEAERFGNMNGAFMSAMYDSANNLATDLSLNTISYNALNDIVYNAKRLLWLYIKICLRIPFISSGNHDSLVTSAYNSLKAFKQQLRDLKDELNAHDLNPCYDFIPWEGPGIVCDNYTAMTDCICKMIEQYSSLTVSQQMEVDNLTMHITNLYNSVNNLISSPPAGLAYYLPPTPNGCEMMRFINYQLKYWCSQEGNNELGRSEYDSLKNELQLIIDKYDELIGILPSGFCDGCSTEFNTGIYQSPYIYLQAAGSDGSDGSVEGIHLRWTLRGEIGDHHIPKGDLANEGSSYHSDYGYIKDDDFVKLHKTLYTGDPNHSTNPTAPVTLDFSSDTPYKVDETNDTREWTFNIRCSHSCGIFNNDIIVRFTDDSAYDTIKSTPLDPVNDTFDFIKAYHEVLEIEVKGKALFAADINVKADSGGDIANLKYEVISTSHPSANDFSISVRKEVMESPGNDIDERIECELIKYLRMKFSNGYPNVISLETYDDFIVTRPSWTAVGGDFGLTDSNSEAFDRLESTGKSIDNLWPRYNHDVKVKKDNYEDKWESSPSDTEGIKQAVKNYLSLSKSDTKAVDELEINTGTEISIEIDGSNETEDSKLPISYLDTLALVSQDFHVARMLGLGFIDNDSGIGSSRFVYIAVYQTDLDYINHRDPTLLRDHIFMSLPTGKADDRLPATPGLKNVDYGIPNFKANEFEEFIDANGYAKYDQCRFVILGRESFDFEIEFENFFANSTQFDTSQITASAFYGLEFREDSETPYRKPEITNNFLLTGNSYEDYNGGPGSFVKETVPLLDNPDAIFVHKLTEEGIHHYALYSINWFSRASAVGSEKSTTNTQFILFNSLKPPTGVLAHYIQKEDPRLFTTAAEQTEWDSRFNTDPGDPNYTRLVFQWNHLQKMNYQTANKVEIFFKEELPIQVKGKISSISKDSSSENLIIATTSFHYSGDSSDEEVIPTISSSDVSKFSGSIFSTSSGQFEVVSVTSGTNATFVIKPIKDRKLIEKLDGSIPGNNVSARSFVKPQVGEIFQVIENLSNDSNWLKLNQSVTLVNFSDATEEFDQPDGGSITQVVGGIVNDVTVTSDETVGTTNPIEGLYKVAFENSYSLSGHPQSPDVTYYKGTIRIEKNDSSGEKKVLEVWTIEQTSPLIVWAFDPEYDQTTSSNNIKEGTGVDANFHPGYKVYLENESGFDKNVLLPSGSEVSKQSLLAVRSIHDTESPVPSSALSSPISLVGLNLRTPVQPTLQLTTVPIYATRPNKYGKSSFTFDMEIEDDTFSIVVERAADIDLLEALYDFDTVEAILESIADLDSMTQRFSELVNVVVDGNGDFNVFEGYGFPTPDSQEILDMLTANSQLPAPEQLSTEQVYRLRILEVFDSVVYEPFIIEDLKSGKQTSNSKPNFKDDNGDLLEKNHSAFNPYPFAVKDGSAPTTVRFTDYSLDGAAKNMYFYHVKEITRELKYSAPSVSIGPVFVVNGMPAFAPEIKKIYIRPSNLIDGIGPAVQFEINQYLIEENIQKVQIFRAYSIEDSSSLSLMQLANEVDWSSLADSPNLVDEFIDLKYPPYGEKIYYRLVALRRIINEFGNEEYIPSIPSKAIVGSVIEDIAPQAPNIEVESIELVPSSGNYSIKVKWNRTTHNGIYNLYFQDMNGSWDLIYNVETNDDEMQYPPLNSNFEDDFVNHSKTKDLPLIDVNGNRIFYKFKVDVIGKSGLVNLTSNEISAQPYTYWNIQEWIDNSDPISILNSINDQGSTKKDEILYAVQNKVQYEIDLRNGASVKTFISDAHCSIETELLSNVDTVTYKVNNSTVTPNSNFDLSPNDVVEVEISYLDSNLDAHVTLISEEFEQEDRSQSFDSQPDSVNSLSLWLEASFANVVLSHQGISGSGSIANGSDIVNCTGTSFTSEHVGQLIRITTSTMQVFDHVIVSVNSSTNITLDSILTTTDANCTLEIAHVSSWNDKSSKSNDFSQSNASKQPVYFSNLLSNNNKPSLYFDGVDDFLVGSKDLSGTRTIYLVLMSAANTGSNSRVALSDKYNSGTEIMEIVDSGTSGLAAKFSIHTSELDLSSTSVDLRSNFHILTLVAHPSDYKLRLDEVAIQSSDSLFGIASPDNVHIGNNSLETFPWLGYISEVLVYSAQHSSKQIERVEQYLIDKYSL